MHPAPDYRAWLAGQALAGLCANHRWLDEADPGTGSGEDFDIIGRDAVALADAVIRALDASPSQARPDATADAEWDPAEIVAIAPREGRP